mmetsp:Transcript_123973/g.246852  ORF Transcript_123973/g.246852 Transcript_123973/m.246852 type:complete len:495 (+) Transcript_123973:133-1617(+)
MAARATRAAFFIFDPTIVPESPKPSDEEISDAKIIYYSPSCAPAEEKRSQVGLLEGLIAFTGMFGSKEPLRSIRTKQLAFSVLEAEPNTWMVLVMRHGSAAQDSKSGTQQEASPDEDGLADTTLRAVLRNCYAVFRLLHGEIQSFVKEQSMHKLFDLLEDFIPAFLETIDASNLGIFHDLDGFHYGPVERNTCVSIHCFLMKLQEQFPLLRHAALLYNAHLIYFSLSMSDMKVLYSYLVSFNGAVSNHKLNRGPFGRIPTAASQPGGGCSSFGRAFLLAEEEDYLLGVSRRPGSSGSGGPASIFVPAVYLVDGGAGQLVALMYRGIMLVLVFEEHAQLDSKILESVRTAATRAAGDGLSLAELHPLIASQYSQVMDAEDEFRFLYYNHTNHAVRLSNQPSTARSLLGGSRPGGGSGPRPAERVVLSPLHAALADPTLKCREISWKSSDRGWICGKRWREREFYLLLDGSSMTLSKCQEECARFASIHFSNIFLM